MVQVGYSCQSIWQDLLLQKLHEIGQTVTPESRFQILVNFIYYESYLVHMNWWYTFKFAWCKAPARSQNAELSVCDLRKKPIFFLFACERGYPSKYFSRHMEKPNTQKLSSKKWQIVLSTAERNTAKVSATFRKYCWHITALERTGCHAATAKGQWQFTKIKDIIIVAAHKRQHTQPITRLLKITHIKC